MSAMSAEEYQEIAGRLGFNLGSLGRFLRVSARTAYRYPQEGNIPGVVADLLRALDSGKVTVKDIENMRRKYEKNTAKRPRKK